MTAKFLGIGLVATLLTCVTATPMQAKGDDTRFSSPIVGSAVGTTIAGIPSGGAPWVVIFTRAWGTGEVICRWTGAGGVAAGAAGGDGARAACGAPAGLS